MADRISIVRNSFWFPFGTKIYSSELNSWDHRTLVVCTDGKWCGCYCCCCYCFLNQKKKRRERERVEMKFRLRWWWWWWWSSPEITQSDRERGVVGRNGQSVVLSEEEGDGQGGKKSSCVCVCLFVSSLFFFSRSGQYIRGHCYQSARFKSTSRSLTTTVVVHIL